MEGVYWFSGYGWGLATVMFVFLVIYVCEDK